MRKQRRRPAGDTHIRRRPVDEGGAEERRPRCHRTLPDPLAQDSDPRGRWPAREKATRVLYLSETKAKKGCLACRAGSGHPREEENFIDLGR